MRIGHAISSELYEPAAEGHTQFGHPRFVIISFVSPYHGPGGVNARSSTASSTGSDQFGMGRKESMFASMPVRRDEALSHREGVWLWPVMIEPAPFCEG